MQHDQALANGTHASVKNMKIHHLNGDDLDNQKQRGNGDIYYNGTAEYSNELLNMLNILRNNRQLCDLIIQIDDDNDIYCHQLITACNSKLFMELFINNDLNHNTNELVTDSVATNSTDGNHSPQMQQINRLNSKYASTKQLTISISKYLKHLNEFTHDALKCCIDYMYTGELYIPQNLINEVYTISHVLSFESILNICSKYLISNLNNANCLDIRSYAYDYNLIQNSTEYIKDNFENLFYASPSQLMSLPRINIELITVAVDDSSDLNFEHLIFSWLRAKLKSEDLSVLCDNNVNLLYFNDNDKTLHDCHDMEQTNKCFCDYVYDYQHTNHNGHHSETLKNGNKEEIKKEASERNVKATESYHERQTSTALFMRMNIKDDDLYEEFELQSRNLQRLHNNEIICTHKMASGDNCSLMLCILNNNLVLLSVQQVTAQPNHEQNSQNASLVNNKDDEQQKQVQQSKTNDTTDSNEKPIEKPSNGLPNDILRKHAKMESPRCSHGLINFDSNKLIIIGGYNRAECFSTCEIYNHQANKITPFESLVHKRGRASYLIHSGDIYVLGGSDGHEELNSLERFDTKLNKWICLQLDVKFDCSNVGAASDNEFIYIVAIKDNKETYRNCLKYNPILNSFSRIASLQSARCQCSLIRHKDFLYVFGGHDHIRCLNTCEAYNTKENGKWTTISPMMEPRRGCGAAEKNGLIYIVGGTNGSCSLKSTEIYNTYTNRFSGGPELNVPRANVAIAFIGNYLFAVGGFDGKQFLRTMEYLNCDDLATGWSIYHKPMHSLV